MINRIMTSRAAAVALAASALIAAPAFAVDGNKQGAELLGGPQSPQIVARSGQTQTGLTTVGYNDDRRDRDRGHDRNNGYNVRTGNYGNPVIRCSSADYRTAHCAAPRGYRIRDVRIVNKRSSASCNYGSDWGYDRNSVWVTDGCRADFALLSRRGNEHHANDRRQRDYGYNNGYSRRDIRRMSREARRSCEYVLGRRADIGGWRHAEYVNRPQVEQIGSRSFRVYGTVHLGRGHNQKSQNVTCTVRRGTVYQFTELYPAYNYGNGHHRRDGY